MNRAVLHNLESLVEGGGRGKKKKKKKEKRKCWSPQRGQTRGSEITITAIRSQVCSCLYLEIDSSLRRGKNGSWISHTKQGKSPISTKNASEGWNASDSQPVWGSFISYLNRHSAHILPFLSLFLLSIRLKYLVKKKRKNGFSSNCENDWKVRANEELRNAVAGKRSCSWLRSWFAHANLFLVAYGSYYPTPFSRHFLRPPFYASL